MLTCLALAAALSSSGMASVPALTAEIEAEARALALETQMTPALLARIDDLSGDASRLSAMLETAGVGQDMGCIFAGIAKDARDRAAEFIAADTEIERETAFINLRMLMDDTALMAPLAATAAQERRQARDLALR